MLKPIPASWLSVAAFLVLHTCLAADETATTDKPNPAADLARDVQPILAERCFNCHGPDKAEGGLRLNRREAAFAELDSGERAIVPGDVKGSELFRRIKSADPEQRMPPKGEPLAADQIARIEKWINDGAKWAVHWAYRPIQAADPPNVKNKDWPRNEIDRFVLARLEEAGIEPSPEADRHTLIRRLYFDLIGIPPEPADIDAFVADKSPQAYEALVDRLLASQHFGERWGRHWLDKARYADSDGYEKDKPRANAWRYRDWVIDVINADMPFDQFTIEQLAGDLLSDATPMQRLATAFHRQTLTNTEGGADQEQFRVEATFDRVETTSTVWLGLTVGCARCHSHKYDQISQNEYYRLFAFFNSGGESNVNVPRGKDAGEPKQPMLSVRVISQRPRKTRVLHRGDFLSPEGEVQPGTLATLHPFDSRAEKGSADRLDFAQWIVSKDNPLTPRVSVNEIWMHLFGKGLVGTANDFGVRGETPTHPKLLDWLGDRLVNLGWSRKEMIKLIVMSAAYRQSSHHRPELAELDPGNRLLHRQNRFRVEGEIVRDVYLAIGGLLSKKIGGPSVFPPMPPDIAALSYANNFKWNTSKGEDRYRRGMYTFFKRTAPHPNLTTFDCPDANTTKVKREISNSPLQPLTLLNNLTFVEASQALARRLLMAEFTDDSTRLEFGYRLCATQPPSTLAMKRFQSLLDKSRDWYKEHKEDASKLVGNYKPEKVEIEEAAAWVATSRILLNLDATITRE
jgi:hypothetical protein